MSRAKEIVIKPIKAASARAIITRLHYSGKVVQNSQVHFGVFLDGVCAGSLQFGPSLDKKKMVGLIPGTGWNEFIELNRMALADWLPKNCESRAIAVCLRIIKKKYPFIRWVVSFSDATQCGDGAIYRASGFKLAGYCRGSMWKLPRNLWGINKGQVAHIMKTGNKTSPLSRYILGKTNGRNISISECVKMFGGEVMDGYQFRYIYFFDKSLESSTDIMDFSVIDELNARMYKGDSYTRA